MDLHMAYANSAFRMMTVSDLAKYSITQTSHGLSATAELRVLCQTA